MESERSWEQNTLINELIQGLETSRKLKEELRLPSSLESRNLLMQWILSSYDKALLILTKDPSISNSQTMHQATKSTSLAVSPISVNINPLKEDADADEGLKEHPKLKHDSKKRKMMPKWMGQVRVKIDKDFEGTFEDGYNWRKYGQKDILGAKYPRSYYRCTFRDKKGCSATKQIQRSDEDPTLLNITYRGSHTCSKGNDVVLPPKPLEIQEEPHGYDIYVHNAQPSQENLTKCFISPSFLVEELDGVSNMPCPNSDIAGIISANTLCNNSPIGDFNCSLDALEIDPKFPFDASGFLS